MLREPLVIVSDLSMQLLIGQGLLDSLLLQVPLLLLQSALHDPVPLLYLLHLLAESPALRLLRLLFEQVSIGQVEVIGHILIISGHFLGT